MKRKNLCLLASAITSTIVVCSITSISYAKGKSGEAGIRFTNSSSLNRKVYNIIKYVGTCPGSERENIVGQFVHKKVPSGKNTRVRIINQTLKNTSDKVPYTDRKYHKKGRSQKIGFDFGNNHRGSKFVIKPGTNKFSYQIYNGKYGKPDMKIIKEGSFLVNVEKKPKPQEIPRQIKWNSKIVCVDKDGNIQEWKSLEKCRYAGSQKLGTCNGKTVSSELTDIWKNDIYKKKRN